MESSKVLLPREIDIDKCIALKTKFVNARLDPAHLERLQESCVRIDSDVVADVSFEDDLNGIRLIKGQVKADVVLICQRCNNEYVEHLDVDFELSPDFEKARLLHIENKYDFVEFNDHDKIDLYEMIIDSLLLEIPSIPMHDEEDCEAQGTEWSYGQIEESTEDSPFNVLSQLKGNLKQ